MEGEGVNALYFYYRFRIDDCKFDCSRDVCVVGAKKQHESIYADSLIAVTHVLMFM